MAVPKRKTSPSRRGNRRAHDSLSRLNIVFDKESGEPKLQHHVSLKDGTYNGRKLYEPKSKLAKGDEATEQSAETTPAA